MLGFIIGTVCLIGLIKTLRWTYGRGRFGGCHGGSGYGGGFGGGGYGGWGGGGFGPGHHGFGGHDHHQGWGWGGGSRWSGPGFFLRMISERVDATPAQEKVIAAAIDEVREAGRKAREEVRGARSDLAKAMRSPAFDEVLFGEMFAKQDTALDAARKSVMGALGKVHDVLDEKQRERLADLIDRGPSFFRGPFGRASL